MNDKPTELLDLDTVAKILQTSRRTVERYITSGQIAAMKIGGRVRIEQSELTDFFARLRSTAAKERAARSRAAKKRVA
jgi:excisionase family DNA binding protein